MKFKLYKGINKISTTLIYNIKHEKLMLTLILKYPSTYFFLKSFEGKK